MKTYVELGLAALLAVLVYERPKFLVNTANTTLGIVIMIVIVGLLAKQYGINAGLLAAIIMILLQDSHREGYTPKERSRLLKGRKMPHTVGLEMGAKCSADIQCAPCEKLCKKATDLTGKLKTCACKSTCSAGKCSATCACGECGGENPCTDNLTKEQSKLHRSGGIEEYTNINDSLQPSRFPVTGTDQIGLSRMLKVNALNAKMSASQQANGCTNNGGGIAF
ncbi:MAG: hypothetical protein CXT73_05140 [Methanobacteriota archaeon]|nr:MAG: hypothetical protein CXT73_05140 [Euryarchaeota archaeon]